MNPPTADRRTLLRRIRVILAVFVVLLVLSGVMAMPVEWELNCLAGVLGLPQGANPARITPASSTGSPRCGRAS
jgi:hypothetical protein